MWWRTSNCSPLLIYRPREDERLSWPGWLTYSGWLTHVSGHPSATGRAQDGERTLARDWRSTAEPRGLTLKVYRFWTIFGSGQEANGLSIFQRGWVTLSANFRWKGTSATHISWCQKTRVTNLSYGMKISAEWFSCFVTKHACDRWTDRQNYNSQYCTRIAASCGKNVMTIVK